MSKCLQMIDFHLIKHHGSHQRYPDWVKVAPAQGRPTEISNCGRDMYGSWRKALKESDTRDVKTTATERRSFFLKKSEIPFGFLMLLYTSTVSEPLIYSTLKFLFSW